ncbi:hypothetical protein P3T76_002435 [Phytophthora citrophthora]|uniref:Elicitin n=1 Tax=Phytophthora citrophthora TaxID=4793 RepID=A0AAD9LRH6_9STRA|nr:hypothetical protein P3T76_002435 [Phytophthora citrophthora]
MTRVLVALALFVSSSLAATCTVFQIHTTIQDIDGVLSNDKCSDYVANSSSLLVPCDASSCVSVVEDLVTELPDCALSANDNGGISVNKKKELQTGLDTCSEDSSASLLIQAVDTERTPSTTSPGDECSMSEASITADLYLEAAKSSACERYVTTDEMAVYIYAPCSATQCVATMENLAEQLPNCFIDGDNLKEDVQQSLAQCTGSSSVGSSPRSGSECTNDEVSSLAYLTNSIVTSNDCESYVIATETEWLIEVPCSATTCLSVMDEALQQMPDCEFEGINYKEELGLQQQSCVDDVGSSVTSGSASKHSLSTAAPASGASNSTDTSDSTLYTAGIATLLAQVVIITMTSV